jgi:hypothetical protein
VTVADHEPHELTACGDGLESLFGMSLFAVGFVPVIAVVRADDVVSIHFVLSERCPRKHRQDENHGGDGDKPPRGLHRAQNPKSAWTKHSRSTSLVGNITISQRYYGLGAVGVYERKGKGEKKETPVRL